MKPLLTFRRSVKLHNKFIESTEDGDLMLTLNADVWLKKRLNENTTGEAESSNTKM